MHSVHGKSPKKRILPFFSFGFLVLKNIKIKKSLGVFLKSRVRLKLFTSLVHVMKFIMYLQKFFLNVCSNKHCFQILSIFYILAEKHGDHNNLPKSRARL